MYDFSNVFEVKIIIRIQGIDVIILVTKQEEDKEMLSRDTSTLIHSFSLLVIMEIQMRQIHYQKIAISYQIKIMIKFNIIMSCFIPNNEHFEKEREI